MSLDFLSIPLTRPNPLFTQVPALDTVHDKLASIEDAPSLADPSKIKDDPAQEIFPWLKQRYVEKLKVQVTLQWSVRSSGQ